MLVAQRDVMPGSFKRKISNWKSLVIQAASFKVISKPQGFSVTQIHSKLRHPGVALKVGLPKTL